MPKIIVEYSDSIHPIQAMRLVESVIERGRISKARGQEQYCFVTVFSVDGKEVEVFARDRRDASSPDSFVLSVLD